ncbi:MAG: hypothetical protein LBJ69_02395 [Holosporales bacterium]|jgi:hypothetical protein|nr:hypothetical protein [Holosporales bacterium]
MKSASSCNRPLSKPSESELLLGDTEHRSGVHKGGHKHSSTESTKQETDCAELAGALDNIKVVLLGTPEDVEDTGLVGQVGTVKDALTNPVTGLSR